MSRRIIPGLCALALAVPATALAQPAHDPPAAKSGPVAYGDTKYDLQNQQGQKAAVGKTAYEQAISGDTKGDLPRAIAPAPATPSTQVKPAAPASAPSASTHDTTDRWQIAAWVEGALLATGALGVAAVMSGRTRSRRLGT